jgi:hypothetical protein
MKILSYIIYILYSSLLILLKFKCSMEVVNSVVSKDTVRSVIYIRRQVNRVTHELAQVAHFFVSSHTYDYCPPCIEYIIMSKMD